MHDFDYYRPESGEDLAAILNHTGGRIVAGGTDILPRLRRGQLVADCLIDISRLANLRYICEVDGQIHIGALTTYVELIASPLVQRFAPALTEAAASVGCLQTRQRGTVGGNLANASPAADSALPLLIHDAKVHLASVNTVRSVPISTFFCGPGVTSLQAGEYVDHISFNLPTGKWGTAFYKLGKRSGMAISIASTAAYLELDQDGCLKTARVAFGSVAPNAIRSSHAEAILLGQVPCSELFRQAGQAALSDISPIGDVRSSLEYRTHVVPVLAQRALMQAWQQAEKRIV